MSKQVEKIIEGWDAIEAKQEDDRIILNKYADPIEDARDDISINEAEELAYIDQSLIYATVRGDE